MALGTPEIEGQKPHKESARQRDRDALGDTEQLVHQDPAAFYYRPNPLIPLGRSRKPVRTLAAYTSPPTGSYHQEPFFLFSTVQSWKYEGTGMGVSLVKSWDWASDRLLALLRMYQSLKLLGRLGSISNNGPLRRSNIEATGGRGTSISVET